MAIFRQLAQSNAAFLALLSGNQRICLQVSVPQMNQNPQKLEISDLDAWILETIDNIGWHAYLWFPVVYREVLNFGSDESDEEVYRAFVSLIENGALIEAERKHPGDPPVWTPRPDALATAKNILSSKFGFPAWYRPKSEKP